MNDKTPHEPTDDAFARLQAADPAANIEPSAGFTDRVIAEASTAPEVVTLATERERRRPLWQTLVGAAAAIAIVGGTGFGIGASGVGTPVSSTADAPISLGESAAEPLVGPQTVEGGPTVGETKDSVARYPGFYGGRYTYTAVGLGTEPGTANGYGFDPRSVSNPETIAALAAAFGVEGAPELKDGAWQVGPQDGTGSSIYVSLDGTLSFSYYNSAIQPWQCDENGACAENGAAAGEESALSTLRDLLGKLGYNLSDFELSAQTWEGSLTTHAVAWRLVDGQRTDQSISIDVAESGITNANGTLAPIVELGEYSIVSEQEAFERLYDSRFGGFMSGGPIALEGMVVDDAQEYVPPTEPPATPVPGASVSWPVTNVQIVSARLGLASQYQPDGSVLLVPAYEFTDSNGGTWSVIAVAESHLDFATE